MKRIEFEHWIQDTENPRKLTYAGQRTAEDVFTNWKRIWTAWAICQTSIFFWTVVGKTDARCPETLAFSVGQTTAEAKASIWICFWNGTRTVSAGQSIS